MIYDELYVRVTDLVTGASLQAELDLLARLLDGCGRVLDAACGYGRLGVPLAQAGLDVAGFDRSAPLVEEARQRAASSGLSPEAFRLGDVLEAPWHNRLFDAAFVWHHTLGFARREDDERFVGAVGAALMPGGRLLLQQLNPSAVRHHLQVTGGQFVSESSTLRVQDDVRLDGRGGMITERTIEYAEGSATQTFRSQLYEPTDLRAFFTAAGMTFSALGESGNALEEADRWVVAVGHKPK